MGWDRLLGCAKPAPIASSGVRIAQPRSKSHRHGPGKRRRRDESGLGLSVHGPTQVIDSLRRNASARVKLFTQPIDVLFYDTTTLYFQSDREDYGQNKDPLRFKGYSKDGKPHRTQVVLALLVTRGGIPLDYELYPGNTYEGDTLCRALDGITERYDVSRVTVVADAGLLAADGCASATCPTLWGFAPRMHKLPDSRMRA